MLAVTKYDPSIYGTNACEGARAGNTGSAGVVHLYAGQVKKAYQSYFIYEETGHADRT